MITNKAQMYAMLAQGLLGNTLPQYFSVDEWRASGQADRYDWWGVRTLVPGGPCFLNCHRDDVEATALRPEYAAAGVNISAMVDRVCTVTMWAEVQRLPGGLYTYVLEYPPKEGSWRKLMPAGGKGYQGTAARLLLERHLNANALGDLYDLLNKYDGHVVEFSAIDICMGRLPGRNMIVWEVRNY